MIIQLQGYERHEFTDKQTGRQVVYFDIYGLEPSDSHQSKTVQGNICRAYRMSRVNELYLALGGWYEVIFDIVSRPDGSYTAKPRDLRQLDPDSLPF